MTDDRETLIANLVAAWNAVPQRDKSDLMLAQPALYWAAARLGASETVKAERNERKPRAHRLRF